MCNPCLNRDLIVPLKEKKSRLLKKVGRSKSEQATSEKVTTVLTGLLETMRIQMKVKDRHVLLKLCSVLIRF